MELKEFKARLEKQGVSYELFCERYSGAPPIYEFIKGRKNFHSIITGAFTWHKTPEGVRYWESVEQGQIVTPTTLGFAPKSALVFSERLRCMKDKEPKGMTTEEFFTFFEETTARMIEISRAKNSDYTGSADNDPFANFTRVEALGICSTEQGFLTRMTDKLSRIASFVKQGNLKVKDESVQDTLLDLANYSILMLAYLESKKT